MLKPDHGLLKISRAKALSLYKHSPELIPKIIHRIWLGDKPMPDSHIRFGKTWEKNHPGWIVKLWRDPDELPFKMRLHSLYKNATPRSSGKSTRQANFMIHEIIYNLGGIYIDTDFECVKSLEPLLSDVEAFVGATYRYRAAAQWSIFGARPKHPWLDAMIESIRNDSYYSSPNAVPSFTETQLAVKRNSKLIKKYKVKIFSGKIFFPFLRHEKEEYQRDPGYFINSDTYAIHHWRGGWC